jgi:hypothetical protein
MYNIDPEPIIAPSEINVNIPRYNAILLNEI